ncbi:sensor histidine kinase [Halocola ammonii]
MNMRAETTENLFRRVREIVRMGTWEVDLVNETVEWSNVTRKIHEVEDDYTPTIEKGIFFYKEGENREKIRELFNKCITEQVEFDVDLEIITAKGNSVWVRSIGTPVIENGKCTRVYGLLQDITESKQNLKRLELKEEQFRRTFDYSAIGMALVSLKGNWLRVNNQLCEMLGYSKEEFLDLTFQDITHPDDLNADLENVSKMLKGQLDSYEMEKRYFHKNGEIVWAVLSVSMVKDADNKPLHFVSQITNISERKKAEMQEKKLLKVTNEQNNRLLNFAHIVSHNLRSHSGNIRLLIDLTKEQAQECTGNEFFPLLDQASENLEETIVHLNQVAVMNLSANQELEPLSLNSFIAKAIGNVKALLYDSEGELVDKAEQDYTVKAIPAYLESVILNYLTNSIKYRSEDRKLRIVVDTDRVGDFIKLSVSDNGRGIDLNRHGEKLFGMYKVFHKHKDARGIGLFITKNQVEAMGGRIEVESEPGQGTTFHTYLPYEKD